MPWNINKHARYSSRLCHSLFLVRTIIKKNVKNKININATQKGSYITIQSLNVFFSAVRILLCCQTKYYEINKPFNDRLLIALFSLLVEFLQILISFSLFIGIRIRFDNGPSQLSDRILFDMANDSHAPMRWYSTWKSNFFFFYLDPAQGNENN